MWEQAKALQEGAEIVVCTPVREKPTFISLLHFKNLPIAAVNPHHLLLCVHIGSSHRPREEEGHIPAESHVPGV